MSEQATELMRRIGEAPVSVQREVAAAVMELQFGGRGVTRRSPLRIQEVAGRYRPQQTATVARHDAWFVEAIQASKSDETPL